MLAFSILVAGSFAFGGRVANDIAPVVLTTLRFTIGAIFLSSIVIIQGSFKREHAKAAWRYFLMGFLMALYFVLMFEGLKTASPVSMAAVFTLTPFIAAGFGWILLRQVTNHRIAGALLIGAIGALWVIFHGDVARVLALDIGRGEAIFFIGVAAHALYAPLVPRLNRGEPPAVFTAGMLIGGSVLLWIYAWPEMRHADYAAMPAAVWWVLAYVSLAATSTTFFLLQYASLRIPAAKVMAYTYFTPSVVLMWEMVLGAGTPKSIVLIGVLLCVCALIALLMQGREGQSGGK